jgi:hypothetical protein
MKKLIWVAACAALTMTIGCQSKAKQSVVPAPAEQPCEDEIEEDGCDSEQAFSQLFEEEEQEMAELVEAIDVAPVVAEAPVEPVVVATPSVEAPTEAVVQAEPAAPSAPLEN